RDTLYLFRKEPYQFGRWSLVEKPIPLQGPVESDETSLVAGAGFAALHVGGTSTVRIFHFDERDAQWHDFDFTNPSSPNIPIAADGNALLASFYDDSTRTTRDRVYFLDAEGRWQASPLLSASQPFTWSASYANGYWEPGGGFGVGTYVPDGSPTTRVRIVQW